MWHIKLTNGLTIAEGQIANWDALPPETEIESAALLLPRPDGTSYVIELSGYDRYCIARSVAASVGGVVHAAGYCAYGQRGEVVTELEVWAAGMHLQSYLIDRCELPDPCWRRGTRKA